MKIASIDIGTNSIKSKIFDTTPTSITFLEGIRTPVRLGTKVFNTGGLSEKKVIELIKVLKKYQHYFLKNNVEMYEIIATSAFRDSVNSEEARRTVENAIEHPINIISGLQEVQLIRLHPKAQDEKNKVFVDIGGGSTEIYIYKNGKTSIQSFQLGGVRNLLKMDSQSEWKRMENWLKKQENCDTLVGLGGNIKSFMQISKKKKISKKEFRKQKIVLKKQTTSEKIKFYNLGSDRADVIDYALDIFEKIIDCLDVALIKSTKWGVSDSTSVKLFHELYSKKISIER